MFGVISVRMSQKWSKMAGDEYITKTSSSFLFYLVFQPTIASISAGVLSCERCSDYIPRGILVRAGLSDLGRTQQLINFDAVDFAICRSSLV